MPDTNAPNSAIAATKDTKLRSSNPYPDPKCCEPLKINPLIKLGRWSFLILGFVYGVTRRRILSESEIEFRKVEAEKKKIMDLKIAEEKYKLEKETNKAVDDWCKANANKKQENHETEHELPTHKEKDDI